MRPDSDVQATVDIAANLIFARCEPETPWIYAEQAAWDLQNAGLLTNTEERARLVRLWHFEMGWDGGGPDVAHTNEAERKTVWHTSARSVLSYILNGATA